MLAMNPPRGIELEAAYLRIDDIGGKKSSLHITVGAYASKEVADAGDAPLDQRFFTFTPSVEEGSANYHKQGYEHAKTLTQFSGATDC